jgi:hypothetical protein
VPSMLYYGRIISLHFRSQIATYSVTGLPTTDQYNFTGKPKISASFRLNLNGMVVLEKAEAEITVYELVKITEKKKNTKENVTIPATPEESKEEDTKDETEEETQPSETEEIEQATESPTTSESASAEETTEPQVTEKLTSRIHRVNLKLTPVNVAGMKDEDFAQSKKLYVFYNWHL